MSKIFNQKSYIINSQFSGGESITFTSGSGFDNSGKLYGGLYVGTYGDITVKTADNSVITLVGVSGFVPGLITAVSSSSSATDIVGFF
jgi:hypothetical protein